MRRNRVSAHLILDQYLYAITRSTRPRDRLDEVPDLIRGLLQIIDLSHPDAVHVKFPTITGLGLPPDRSSHVRFH